jgi:Subtilase family/Peptidase inhibitor I9
MGAPGRRRKEQFMPFSAARVCASVMTAGLVAAAVPPGAALAGPHADAAQPTQGVIVVLRNQHTDLSIARGGNSPRVQAAQRDQVPVIAAARRAGVRDIHGFKTVNGFAAAATPTQVASLKADPSVAAVYPDLMIRKAPARHDAAPATGPARAGAAPSPAICPADPGKPLLEPEALQTTRTAYADASTPQAQALATGAGVKVAWLADGIDTNNADFIRPDGSHVFTDYQDFTGEGPDAPSGAAEAFGDASSIAAQGRQVYDLADFVNPAHPLPKGCTITVRGIAPGASLVGLKVFGEAPSAPTSRFIEALDYAVNTAGVDVINESFGSNPFPDLGTDPISLADNAAVDAGVTVVASTGDAGTAGTIGSPGSSPKVIGVAATTTFRSYQQQGYAGVGFSNGTWANGNISSLSSGGVTQRGRVPDLAAPGDLGWAVCSPNTAVYQECTNPKNEPSPIQDFGGTSQSAPFTAGGAALVIEAYKRTHHGVRPAPALVKSILTSTATDLGHPAYEQGAGELNTLAAVRAALSWNDAHGSPAAQGSALVVDNTQLSVAGQPGAAARASLSVRNVSRNTQHVRLSTRTLGAAVTRQSGTVVLNSATAPTFADSFGTVRSYVKQTFSVPVGVDRLDVAAAANTPVSPIRIILIDPHGTYQAFSIPQGNGNYAHADVRFPAFGTWSAYFALSKSAAFNGPVRYSVSTSNFTGFGTVSPSTLTLAPGQSRPVTVGATLPRQPGDVSASVQLVTALGQTTSVPFTVRALIPTKARTNTFGGTLTGGNGRGGAGRVAQSNAYYLDVPAGKKDLGIGVTLADDPGVAYYGVLTAPDGQVYSFQTNQFVQGDGKLGTGRSLQIYRRNPQPGRWLLVLDFTNPVSGLAVAQRFSGTLAFDSVRVQASLPHDKKAKLRAHQAVRVPVKITNTGVAPLTFFADGRLDATGDLPLAELTGHGSDIALPLPPGFYPQWLVPTDSTGLTVAASATQPVNLDLYYNSGEPEIYSAAQGDGAIVRVNARQVSPGLWAGDVGQTGPFAGPAPAGTVSVAAIAHGQLFDPAVTSSTGDVWQAGLDTPGAAAPVAKIRVAGPLAGRLARAASPAGAAAPAADGPAPVTVAPGRSVTITVTITPTAAKGTTVRGHLYVDTFSQVTSSGDEVIDLPYTYTVG